MLSAITAVESDRLNNSAKVKLMYIYLFIVFCYLNSGTLIACCCHDSTVQVNVKSAKVETSIFIE